MGQQLEKENRMNDNDRKMLEVSMHITEMLSTRPHFGSTSHLPGCI